MKHQTTITYKSQITIPKVVREQAKIPYGAKIDMFPIPGGFIGRVRRKTNISRFAGDLKHLDDGTPYEEIKQQIQEGLAKEAVERYEKTHRR